MIQSYLIEMLDDPMTALNIDTQELDKFAKLAAHWWDPEGELKTLHQVNPLRSAYIAEKCKLSGLSVVDIGCGGGILSESLAKQGAHVTGIDMNPSLIEVAKLHQVTSGTQVTYLLTTAEQLSDEKAGCYDVVTCLEMLEHVPDPIAIVKACQKLVKPGGHVFFSTLNRNIKAYLFAVLGAEYLLKMLPKGTHDYSKFIQPAELHRWSLEAGLLPIELSGIHYHPFKKVFSLSKDVAVNYLFYLVAPK